MWTVRLLLMSLCSAVLAAAWATDDLPILVYPCPCAEAAPVIDGQLDDSCWQAAPVVGGFTYFARDKRMPVQTFFRVTYDDAGVYFAIICDEPTPEEVSQISVARDSLEIFGQESIEIFLDPGHTHRKYYQLGINAAGSLYDAKAKVMYWNGNAAVATTMGDEAWYVEVAIPWQDIGVGAKPGQVHGFNVCRNRRLGPYREMANWARVMGTFHDPARFAHLVLSPSDEQLGHLGPEFRKGDRSGPIQIFTAEGFGGQSYRLLLKTTLQKLETGLTQLHQLAEQEPELPRQQLQSRLAQIEAEADAAHEIVGGETVDTETFTRWDLRLNELAASLKASFNDIIWEARLQALLSRI